MATVAKLLGKLSLAVCQTHYTFLRYRYLTDKRPLVFGKIVVEIDLWPPFLTSLFIGKVAGISITKLCREFETYLLLSIL